MVNGQWSMVNGEWAMVNGQWSMWDFFRVSFFIYNLFSISIQWLK